MAFEKSPTKCNLGLLFTNLTTIMRWTALSSITKQFNFIGLGVLVSYKYSDKKLQKQIKVGNKLLKNNESC
jgi:hypothetical protein